MRNDKKIAIFFDCENVSADYVPSIFDELANYGEYSGAPSENETFEYAKCVIEAMMMNNQCVNIRWTFKK